MHGVGISGVSSQAMVEEVLSLALEVDQVQWHWGAPRLVETYLRVAWVVNVW